MIHWHQRWAFVVGFAVEAFLWSVSPFLRGYFKWKREVASSGSVVQERK